MRTQHLVILAAAGAAIAASAVIATCNSARGASPVWSRNTATCSGVYCHGARLKGGTHTTPTWTQVDGSQVACGSCHAAPPPPETGHPPVAGGREACSACHPDTVNGDGTI